MKGSLKEIMGQFGKKQWLLVLAAGILLVVITFPVKEQSEKDKEMQESATGQNYVQTEQISQDAYRESIESQLEELLSQVEGAGKVQVMVTLAGTGELVVEKDIPQTQSEVQEGDSGGGTRTSSENTWEEATVYSERDGNSEPYVVKELVPDIEGICVLAQGGGNGEVATNISEAVQALFSIEIHKIKVMKMK